MKDMGTGVNENENDVEFQGIGRVLFTPYIKITNLNTNICDCVIVVHITVNRAH